MTCIQCGVRWVACDCLLHALNKLKKINVKAGFSCTCGCIAYDDVLDDILELSKVE